MTTASTPMPMPSTRVQYIVTAVVASVAHMLMMIVGDARAS
ncbi:MAG: hypothetical protein ACRDWY_00360 [Actinomycetes bacterium]